MSVAPSAAAPVSELQSLCERGQDELMRMDYLAAQRTLQRAEQLAFAARDFDTISRLYMPLQEARRQIRQRCGEGVVCLDLIAQGLEDKIDGRHVIENFPHAQLLVAGWGTIEPAVRCRQLIREHNLFAEVFLAAAYPAGAGRAIAIVPLEDVKLPPTEQAHEIDELSRKLPAHSLLLSENELPRGQRKGTWQTYAEVMAMWERLHAPFLAAADMQVDAMQKIEGYRKTIRVDYACELAHQKLSDVARELARRRN